MLSSSDFQAEQQYFLHKLRHHNKYLHGAGVVTGLELSVSQSTTPLCVVISPRVAISPEGEELILVQPLALRIEGEQSPQYVTIRYVERETDPVSTLDTETWRPLPIEG